mmetsp:Transcript_18314/g.51739  ORF Transcript_18314/g.51739 Transcript_18314/m.51739 type:complete len:158 (+) Transcript_18314:86-559(+)
MKDKGSQFDARLHDHCVKAGFVFRNGRYYSDAEPTWEKEKRIEKGRRQFAVPASSVEQFLQDEEKMVTTLVAKLREKAGVPASRADDDGVGVQEDVEPPKEKKKRKATEAEAEAEEEEAPKEKKKKRKAEEADEAEEEPKKEKKKKRKAEEEEEDEE